MRYRLYYRLDSEAQWRPMLKPSEKLTSTDYSWDTSSLPEGTYRIMVEGTDELANPPDRVQKHSLTSGPGARRQHAAGVQVGSRCGAAG